MAQHRISKLHGAWAHVINRAALSVGVVIVELGIVYHQSAGAVNCASSLGAVEDADRVVVQVAAARYRESATRIDVERAAKESGVAGELAVTDR